MTIIKEPLFWPVIFLGKITTPPLWAYNCTRCGSHQLTTKPGQQFCTSLLGRNSQAIYARICSKKCREVCEPAQSRCTWTYHKHQFVREFAAGQVERPDLTPALKLTVRTPQCAHRECVQMQGMSQGAFKTLEEDDNAMCCCVVNSNHCKSQCCTLTL